VTYLLNDAVPAGTPAVHALIVAVGEYPYLENGAKKPPRIDTASMGQLASPPVSAARMAEWLIKDLRPRGAKVATVEVLCSGKSSFRDSKGKKVTPERATLANVRAAVNRWYQLADTNPDNIALFYFCGHGVTSGAVDSVLLEEFGSDPLDPFNSGAVDATAFSDGMRKCKAVNQLFLFDACRTAPQTYLRDFGAVRGVPLVSAAPHTGLGQINQACIWASELGLPAYGRIGDQTVFTEAFLGSVKGASAERDPGTGDWLVQCSRLVAGMEAYVKRILGQQRQFVNATRMTIGFPLHVLNAPPVVPIQVSCAPLARMPQIELRFSNGQTRPPGQASAWHLELPYGNYKVEAHEGANLRDTQDCPASPPSALVVVNV
jgi:hypothetical protein